VSAVLVILIIVLAALAIALIALFLLPTLRRRQLQAKRQRERLAEHAAGHRQEAGAHTARADELAPKAQTQRREDELGDR
jgi:NADH:ubiquinone oxidoreductase subunit 3 (subunit A)